MLTEIITPSSTDSILNSNLPERVDSLISVVKKLEQSQVSVSDVLSHQDTLFSSQTTIFVFIIAIFVGLPIVLYYNRIRKKLRAIKKSLKELEAIKITVDEQQKDINRINRDSLRALWEKEGYGHFQVIWHIRYCAAILRDNNKNVIKGHFVGNAGYPRFMNLEKEYYNMKDLYLRNPKTETDYKKFHDFESLGGIKKTLLEILNTFIGDEYKEVRVLAATILRDLDTPLDGILKSKVD